MREKLENVYKILESNTTEEASGYIEKKEVFNLLAEKAKQKCEEHCRKNGWNLEVETLILSADYDKLLKSSYMDKYIILDLFINKLIDELN